MNKLEILTFLKRKNELFLKLNIDDILEMSSNVRIHDIYDLTLEKKLFPNLNNINENSYHCIFIVIIDKKTNDILESRSLNISFKDEKLNFNIRHINNIDILDEYLFYISIIPAIEENKKILQNFVKSFYEPMKLFPKSKVINNKLGIISILVLIFSIFFTILQVDITNELITNYGFVDNIINNLTIFNSIILYFYDSFVIKNIYPFLMLYLVGLIVLLIPSLINFAFEFFNYLYKRSCNFYEKEYMYLKIKLNNSLNDVKSNFVELYYNPSFLFKYTLIYFFTMILLFAPIMKILSDNNIKNNLNFKGKIIEKYLESSTFPIFLKIEKINEKQEKQIADNILILGYDNVYTYYYEYKYIKDKLNEKFKSFDKNKYDYREMLFSEVYAYNLKDISKEKLKYIRNIDYKIIEKLDDKFYSITLKEIK